MAQVLKPTITQEMQLYRAAAPLIAPDETKPFHEMYTAYRRACGISLENIGALLSKQLNMEDNDDYDTNVVRGYCEPECPTKYSSGLGCKRCTFKGDSFDFKMPQCGDTALKCRFRVKRTSQTVDKNHVAYMLV